MRHPAVLVVLALAALASACVENTAPGNDREAEVEPPSRAAGVSSVGAALDNVSTALLRPQQITEPDLGSLPAMGERCTFRYTRVGFPVFVYGRSTGALKLNGKLVPLPATGDGRYSDGPVTVTVRPLEDPASGPFLAELVVRFSDAPNELGFHGFAEC